MSLAFAAISIATLGAVKAFAIIVPSFRLMSLSAMLITGYECIDGCSFNRQRLMS